MAARRRHSAPPAPPSLWTNLIELQERIGFFRIDYTARVRPSLAKRLVYRVLRKPPPISSAEWG